MQKIILLLISLSLVGCVTPRGFDKQQSRIAQNYQKPLQEVPVSSNVKLNIANIWPLQMNGTYLQKITASAGGSKHSFSVYLTVSETMVEVVAFNDMAGRLYKMKWTPQKIDWEASSFIPSMIRPENIIADFLLVHLPSDQLQNILYGAYVYEQSDGNAKSRVIYSSIALRNIYYNSPFGNMWGRVVIDNPAFGYRLDIQTVEQ